MGKGDGNCDDKNNVEACEYDGGDCCAKSVMKKGVKTGKVKTTYCTECKCIDPANQGEDEPATCAKPQFKGDGNCDDKNNVEACDYDGGDCCAKSVMKKGVKQEKSRQLIAPSANASIRLTKAKTSLPRAPSLSSRETATATTRTTTKRVSTMVVTVARRA